LFSGRAIGSAFGFAYTSTKYACAAGVDVVPEVARSAGIVGSRLHAYVNGGCFFDGAHESEVLARFAAEVGGGRADGQPMVVAGFLGAGRWVLTGAHLEHEPSRLNHTTYHDELLPRLLATNAERRLLMDYILARALGRKCMRPSKL